MLCRVLTAKARKVLSLRTIIEENHIHMFIKMSFVCIFWKSNMTHHKVIQILFIRNIQLQNIFIDLSSSWHILYISFMLSIENIIRFAKSFNNIYENYNWMSTFILKGLFFFVRMLSYICNICMISFNVWTINILCSPKASYALLRFCFLHYILFHVFNYE